MRAIPHGKNSLVGNSVRPKLKLKCEVNPLLFKRKICLKIVWKVFSSLQVWNSRVGRAETPISGVDSQWTGFTPNFLPNSLWPAFRMSIDSNKKFQGSRQIIAFFIANHTYLVCFAPRCTSRLSFIIGKTVMLHFLNLLKDSLLRIERKGKQHLGESNLPPLCYKACTLPLPSYIHLLANCHRLCSRVLGTRSLDPRMRSHLWNDLASFVNRSKLSLRKIRNEIAVIVVTKELLTACLRWHVPKKIQVLTLKIWMPISSALKG